MASKHTAWGVGHRFREEQDYIERYVRMQRTRSTVHNRQVQDLNRILKRVHAPLLPVRHYDRTGEPYTTEEMSKLLEGVRRTGPEVYQTILGHEQALDAIPSFGLDGPACDYLDRLDEWVDYFVPQLADDPEDDDEGGMVRRALVEAERAEEGVDEEDRIPPGPLKALISLAMEHARHVWFRQRVDAMIYAREQFGELEVLARMAAPDAEINVLRQGFLLLLTAFDAAVFDLTRVAFGRRFFELVGAFGRQDKVSLESIAGDGSFGAFRDRLVEEQLRKRYVKDLLGLLQGIGVELVDPAGPDRPVQLIELILRRNVHVHNRGVVDERYLEADPQTKQPRSNLYNLKLGDVARIDAAYLETANRLCGNCVERLVKWAGG